MKEIKANKHQRMKYKNKRRKTDMPRNMLKHDHYCKLYVKICVYPCKRIIYTVNAIMVNLQ